MFQPFKNYGLSAKHAAPAHLQVGGAAISVHQKLTIQFEPTSSSIIKHDDRTQPLGVRSEIFSRSLSFGIDWRLERLHCHPEVWGERVVTASCLRSGDRPSQAFLAKAMPLIWPFSVFLAPSTHSRRCSSSSAWKNMDQRGRH
jgi:hypothetical protein